MTKEITLCPKFVEGGVAIGTTKLGECTERCAACTTNVINVGGNIVTGPWCEEYEKFVTPKEKGSK